MWPLTLSDLDFRDRAERAFKILPRSLPTERGGLGQGLLVHDAVVMRPNRVHLGKIERCQRRMEPVDRRFHIVGVRCVTLPAPHKDGDAKRRRGGRARQGLSFHCSLTTLTTAMSHQPFLLVSTYPFPRFC